MITLSQVNTNAANTIVALASVSDTECYVVGCLMSYRDIIIDFTDELNLDDAQSLYADDMANGLGKALTNFINIDLPQLGNYSIDEMDYSKAVHSSDAKVRELVALNGKYLAQLSTDSDSNVRLAVVVRLINEIGTKAYRPDMSWFETMRDNEKDDGVWVALYNYGEQLVLNDETVVW